MFPKLSYVYLSLAKFFTLCYKCTFGKSFDSTNSTLLRKNRENPQNAIKFTISLHIEFNFDSYSYYSMKYI